ncbi:MAG: DUF4190 domain-containing protein [Asgard group archaeon]|nr:DUF4190 domain-containing protein [Asgard group archaeon]
MSENEIYCSFCSSIVAPDSEFCSTCGASTDSVIQERTTQASSSYVSVSDLHDYETLGIISIFISVIGCFVFPICGHIIAIIVGHVSQKQGKNKFASIGLTISYVFIGFSILLALILTLVFTLPNI